MGKKTLLWKMNTLSTHLKNKNFCFCFWDNISLCRPHWPGICYVNQGGLNPQDLPVFASRVLELNTCITTVKCFYGIPECRNEWASDSCALSWTRFLMFVLFKADVFCFILLYLLLSLSTKSLFLLGGDGPGF